MLRLRTAWVIVAALVIASVISVSLLDFENKEVEPRGNIAITSEQIIIPTQTTVEPQTRITESKQYQSSPTTTDYVPPLAGQSLSPIQVANAIASTDNTVTLTEWPVKTGNVQLHGIAIDSLDNVFFVSNANSISGPNSNPNIISRLNPSTNEVTEWLRTSDNSARSRSVAIDSSDNVFHTDSGLSQIIRLNPLTGALTTWQLTSGAGPFGIAVDSAGNVFFTEINGNKIGKLNPSTNQITEWTLTTPNSVPFGITVDSLGLVYFTENDGNKIGRLNPTTNAITEWDLFKSPSNPHGIAVDSSNNVFFVEGGGGLAIGKLVPSSNTITEWDLPNAGSGIAIDSADIVYVTEGSDSRNIGRLVSSTDTITDWTLPVSSSNANQIAIDSADNVFFTEEGGNVGRLASSPSPQPPLLVLVDGQVAGSFGGPQVVGVVIVDPDIRTLDDAHGEPDVTINGAILRMVQATDGNWYAFFADRINALIADSNVVVPGTGFDFGVFCSQTSGFVLGPTIDVTETQGFAIQDPALVTNGVDGNPTGTPLTNLCTDPNPTSTPNDFMAVLNGVVDINPGSEFVSPGQIGINQGFWPFIQLYNFDPTGNVIVQYNKGGMEIVFSLTFTGS